MPKIYRRISDGAEVVVAKVHLGNLQKVAAWLWKNEARIYGTMAWMGILAQEAKNKPFLFVVDPLSEQRKYIPSDEPNLPAKHYEFLLDSDA